MARTLKLDRSIDKHERRWLMHKHLGLSPEDIAKAEKCSEDQVKASIQRVEIRKKRNTTEEMQVSQIDIIHHVSELEKQALSAALQATKIVNDKEVPDWDVRNEAIKRINDKIEAVQPKGKGLQIQVNQGQQVSNPADKGPVLGGSNAALNFESIMQRLHAQPQAQLAAPSEAVQDAEYVDTPEPVKEAAASD